MTNNLGENSNERTNRTNRSSTKKFCAKKFKKKKTLGKTCKINMQTVAEDCDHFKPMPK
jgi:hypothetical protein